MLESDLTLEMYLLLIGERAHDRLEVCQPGGFKLGAPILGARKLGSLAFEKGLEDHPSWLGRAEF